MLETYQEIRCKMHINLFFFGFSLGQIIFVYWNDSLSKYIDMSYMYFYRLSFQYRNIINI